MPIPKQEKTEKQKGVPRSSKRNKHQYGSIMIRAAARRKDRVVKVAMKLARLRNKRPVGQHPPSAYRRRVKRLKQFGAPRPPLVISPPATAGA